ncbi:MAG: Bax inhibitor-1/YccA family protein [Rickettsiales bacterium]|nr:Bax inhibitor-1/YccA family protein [Rickettsiales bacterium]
MSNFNNRQSFFSSTATSKTTSFDPALRDYMTKVYNMIAIALIISGAVAFLIANSPALLSAIYTTPLRWVVMLAPLGFVIFINARLNSISAAQAKTYLWIFAGLMGASISWIFAAYTATSVARVFFITASLFGAMSLYGYTTKRDLTSMGSFLFMGLIGIIIASLVNLFLHSSAIHFAVSFLGVLIFTGFTAYDTQNIKKYYYMYGSNNEVANKAATMGALSLYIDFINLFIMLLQFFGDRR